MTVIMICVTNVPKFWICEIAICICNNSTYRKIVDDDWQQKNLLTHFLQHKSELFDQNRKIVRRTRILRVSPHEKQENETQNLKLQN